MDVGYIALAILALGFLIIVHEAGHFFVAKWCGMGIERFSIFFPPAILKRKAKSGTIFQIGAIPFGGFVEIRGMNIAEDIDPDDKAAYPNRPAWQRFLTIFAGPATNYLSAILLAFFLFTCHGVDSAEKYIGVEKVLADYDAVGKLQPGDRILLVDGQPILAGVGKSLRERVNDKQGAPVTLRVRRAGQELDVQVAPKAGKDDKGKPLEDDKGRAIFLLGIQPTLQVDVLDASLGEATVRAFQYPVDQTVMIVTGLYNIVTGKEKADPGGPVRIVDEFKKAFSIDFATGIKLLALLSVYLAIFNLLPFPALDGGRLVFLSYELVTRRRANQKIEAMVHMGGIMVLGVVMILVTLNDCKVF